MTLEYNLSKEESLFIDPKDLYGPSFYIMYGGRAAFYHYEEPVKSAIMEHLPHGGVFFDVGANIGLISFFVSKFRKDAEIYSFEPAPNTSSALKKTIDKNNIQNVHIVKKGVSDKTQNDVVLFMDSKSSGGNSLLKSAISHDVNESEKISLVTLDDFVRESNKIPSLVKVDVQDAEAYVIRGAAELIKNHAPVFIVETNNELMLKDPGVFLEHFKGYNVYKSGSQEIVSIEKFPVLAEKYLSQGSKVLDYVFVKNS